MSDVRRSPSGTFQAVEPDFLALDREIAKRFRDLFGNNTTPEEIQRRLTRAVELQKQAERQCERAVQRKSSEDPLAVAVFLECLRHSPKGNPKYAVDNCRAILKAVDEAGGLKEPQKEDA